MQPVIGQHSPLMSDSDSTVRAAIGVKPISTEQAVFFADVVGSTRLYEQFGDTQAKSMVDECLQLVVRLIAQQGGRLIKTIGDEAMCVLPDADAAAQAAIYIQQKMATLPLSSGQRRELRVGFHCGPVISQGQDVFGDTVNLAARMASLAKAAQIITSHSTVQQMTALLRASCRYISSVTVKGKEQDVDVWEVLWQTNAELTMMPGQRNIERRARLKLMLSTQTCVMERGSNAVVLGRDAGCELTLKDPLASRQHARLDMRRGKFFLVDQSSNGTHVCFDDQSRVALHREELMLRGSGQITFGRPLEDVGQEAVNFEVIEL